MSNNEDALAALGAEILEKVGRSEVTPQYVYRFADSRCKQCKHVGASKGACRQRSCVWWEVSVAADDDERLPGAWARFVREQDDIAARRIPYGSLLGH